MRRKKNKGKLKLLAGPQGGKDAATINQDAKVFVAELKDGDRISYDLAGNRHAWLQVIRGSASVNETALKTGDAARTLDGWRSR